MLMLEESHIKDIGINWDNTINALIDTVECMEQGDIAQPIKPYLRYRDIRNRIIAMPAFVGGKVNMAGIKWIASFPGNIDKGLPRAHSIVILNNADTGVPVAIISTTLLSIIRTASVSGLVVRYFERARRLENIKIGIIGFGPIGQYHLKMCIALLGERISKISLYDIRPVNITTIEESTARLEVVNSWKQAYEDADIVITCTVAQSPYIDTRPKPGSLHLNVSLRDYKSCTYEWFKHSIIVDNWEEVCRERTDIETMHLEKGLQKEATKSIVDIVRNNCLEKYDPGTPIMFNPMGMAIFDIALGNYYYQAGKGSN